MFRHIIKITFRNYSKNLLFTLIIVFGLAVSMSTILVISRYVIREYSTDKFHKEYNNIFLVMNIASDGNSSTLKQDWAEKLTSGYPEVKESCRIDRIELDMIIPAGPVRLNNVLSTDPSFFTMFSFPLIKGDTSEALNDIQSIILTESTAKKLFGKDDPIGKTIKVKMGDDENILTVTALAKDPPAESRIQFEALVSFESKSFHFRSLSFTDPRSPGKHTIIYMCDIYLLLHQKANIPLINNKLKEESYTSSKGHEYFFFLKLQPYSELYFDKSQSDGFKHGDKLMLFIFLTLSILLILLACINYINLSTIKAFSRSREIALKKVSGASRSLLIKQFLLESAGLSFIAFALAIIISKYMSAAFGKMVNSPVDVSWFYNFPQILWILIFALLLGILSGYYPAIYLSQFKTSELFKSQKFNVKFSLFLPKNLFIFQFTIAFTLIISAIIIKNQLNFINTKDLGFNKNLLLHISIPPDIKPFALKEELLKNPGISQVTMSYGIPGNLAGTDGNNWFMYIDSSFLSTYGIKLLQGRNFAPADKNVCLVNETLIKENKWDNFRGKSLGNSEIIGVVKDFHTNSLYEKIVPIEMDFNTSYLPDMTVKLEGKNIAGTIDFIKSAWKRIAPYSAMEYFFYDDWFDKQYKKEEAFGSLISVFTFIAIVISCLGLFGLLSYLIERRAKEIGIRKINGAENIEIMVMLNKDFAKWVGIAFFIALPLAWIAMHKWLENFAYKTVLNWWFFAFAGFIALGIALLTVSWKSWIAASRNPAEVIREE